MCGCYAAVGYGYSKLSSNRWRHILIAWRHHEIVAAHARRCHGDVGSVGVHFRFLLLNTASFRKWYSQVLSASLCDELLVVELHETADSGTGVGELEECHLFIRTFWGQEPDVHNSSATLTHLLQLFFRYFRRDIRQVKTRAGSINVFSNFLVWFPKSMERRIRKVFGEILCFIRWFRHLDLHVDGVGNVDLLISAHNSIQW